VSEGTNEGRQTHSLVNRCSSFTPRRAFLARGFPCTGSEQDKSRRRPDDGSGFALELNYTLLFELVRI